MKKFALKLYNTQTINIDPTRFFENLQVRFTNLDMNSLVFGSLKNVKTSGFLMFSGGIEVEHWLKMG